MIIRDSLFQGNISEGWYGGTIYILESYDVQVIDTKFLDNLTGIQGGAFEMKLSSGEMVGCYFENNKCPFKGNIMFIHKQSNLIIKNSTFIRNTSSLEEDRVSGIGGGFGGININASFNLEIYDSVFDDNIAAQGGDINVLELEKLIIKNSTFKNSQAVSSYGGSIYIMDADYVEIENTLFQNSQGFIGASLGFELVGEVKIKNSQFNQGVSQEQGGAFWFKQITNINLESVTISEYVSQIGAGMYLEQCGTSNMSKLQILDNTAVSFGGGIYIKAQEDLTINESNIINNLGYSGSGIYSEQNKNVNIILSHINSNISENQGGGLYFDSNENLTIQDSNLDKNQAISGGGIYLLLNSGKINIINSKFQENIAQVYGGGLYIENDKSVISFQNVQVLDNTAQSLNGGGIYISQSSKMNFELMDINNNKCGQYGAAIYINRQKQNIEANKINIIGNQSLKNGGGIVILDSLTLSLTESIIKDNVSTENGSAIYSSYTEYLTLNQVDIDNHGYYISDGETKSVLQGGSIYMNNGIQIEIKNSSISKSISEQDGGGLYLTKIDNINIENTEFNQNTSGMYGGSLFFKNVGKIQINSLSKVQQSKLSNEIKTASGGGIYIENCQKIEVSQFTCQDNVGMQYGGCMYLKSAKEVNITQSEFISNSLEFDETLSQYSKNQNYFISYGGAIYLESFLHQENNLILDNILFQNNTASSGASIYIIEGYDNKLNLQIESNNIIFENNLADVGPGIRFIGDQSNLENIQQIESLINKNHKNNIGKVQKDQSQPVIIGYYFNERRLNDLTFQFDLCPLGTYLNTNENVSICKKCIEGADCNGGYISLVPQVEYWRTGIDSDNIVHCYNNPTACRGNDTCADGHLGVLCEECNVQQGYTKTRGGDCVKCSSDFLVALGLLFTGFAYILVQYMSITSVLKRVNQSVIRKSMIKLWDYYITFENRSSGIYKILIFHFQILYLIVNFDYEIIGFVNSIGNVLTDPGTSLTLNFDCIEKSQEFNDDDIKLLKTQHTFYGYLLTIGLLLMIFATFLLKYLMKHMSKKAFKGGIILSMISFFITVQPGFISNSLQSIQCRDVAEISVTLNNSRIQCDDPYYKNTILPINIVILVLTAVLIPIIMLTILIKINKNNALDLLQNRRSFGFLYLEFQKKTFYWDFMLMAQKILIAVITTQYMDQKVIQSALVIIVIFIFMSFTSRKNPYTSKKFTDLLLLSGLVQILTLTFILCIERSESVDLEYFNLLGNILILTINGLFLLSAINLLFPYIFQNAYGFFYQFSITAAIIDKIFKKKFEKERNTKRYWNKLRDFTKLYIFKKLCQSYQNVTPKQIYEETVYEILNNQKQNWDVIKNIFRSGIDPEITQNHGLTLQYDKADITPQDQQNLDQSKNYKNPYVQEQSLQSLDLKKQQSKSQNKNIGTQESSCMPSNAINNNMNNECDNDSTIMKQKQNTIISHKSSKSIPKKMSGQVNKLYQNDFPSQSYRDGFESRDELNFKQSFNNLSQIQMNQQQTYNNSIIKSFKEGHNIGDDVNEIVFTFPDEKDNSK